MTQPETATIPITTATAVAPRRSPSHRWAGALVPLMALCALTGCGAKDGTHSTPVAATVTPVASGGTTTAVSPTSGTPVLPTGNASSGIGDWPSFLPSPSDGGVPTGSLASPAMSYPGSPVVLRIGDVSVRARVDGPSYPASTPVGAQTVDCTFRMTLDQASAPLDLHGASVNVLDSQGGIHQLRATGLGRLSPGGHLDVTIRGILPAGEGLLRLYPTTAGAVAAWDYIAEDD